jgi:hypothetical protein
MRAYFIIAVLPIVLGSCNLLKNTNSSLVSSGMETSAEQTTSAQLQKDWLSKSADLEFTVASDSANYSVQIWPKGAFTYSAENGFSGEAEWMTITGNRKSNSENLKQQNLEQRDQGKIALKKSSENKAVITEKEKTKSSKVSWKLILAGVVLLILAGWGLYRKFIK